MKPRNTLVGTRSNGQIRREFFSRYVRAYTLGGDDKVMGDAIAIFEPTFIPVLRTCLSDEALSTEVVLTDRLSNHTFAGLLNLTTGSRSIVVNARFKVDPEMLAHALLEEYGHVQQVIDQVDFEEQRRLYPDYMQRPYEKEAKQAAADLLGYSLEDFDVYIRREEPGGILYDRVNVTRPAG